MLFDFNFYSSLLLISFSQAIIFSVLLLKKGIEKGENANYWLSLFVFLCALYIAPWMLGFAGWYDNQPYRDFMFYVPFQQLYFIGPIIYFYTQSLLNSSFRFNKSSLIHLIPGFLHLLYSFVVWMVDKVILKSYFFYADGADKDFEQWYQISGVASMIFYFVMSIRYYHFYRKLTVQVVSFADLILFKWINNYLYAFLAMQILQILFSVLTLFYPSLGTYVGNWWFFLLFSIILYYIAITGYANPIHANVGFRIVNQEKVKIFLLTSSEKSNNNEESVIDVAYENIGLHLEDEVVAWKLKIDHIMQQEKLYENPELTLAEVSKKLNSNVSVISRAINQGFQMNFNDLINNYRIEAMKDLLKRNEHKKHTLLGLAFDCGFNSKATFNRAFKKNTGLAPKDFIKQ